MLKAAVIGVGHLGWFHAEKYLAIPEVELIGVVDSDPDRAEAASRKMGVPAYPDEGPLMGRLDLASVVVPTEVHFEVASRLLASGVHVLLEKPVTKTLDEADQLVDLAKAHQAVLQVGHLERFNPAWTAAQPFFQRPLFLEAVRLSPFTDRGTDVDVVLDLMIHDIDLVLKLVGQMPTRVSAIGGPVVTSLVDIANARLEFESGCVANLSASRISSDKRRKFSVFQKDACLTLDLGQKKASIFRKTMESGVERPVIQKESLPVQDHDALEAEIRLFIASVEQQTEPVVTGEDGRSALAVALDILEEIRVRQGVWSGP